MTQGYKKLIERIEKYNKTLPDGIIENRLDYLGFKDLVLHPRATTTTKGFPFKYNLAIDEAILILHYFIIQKHIHKDAKIKLYCIHVPLQEEELTFSFWRSAKAGLFLDCHALIKNIYCSSSEIKRIFVFRDKAHCTQIEQMAISVLYEQMALGIDIGLLFKDKISDNLRSYLKNTVLIDFSYNEDMITKRQFMLLIDNTTKDSSPYRGNDLYCKWFSDTDKCIESQQIQKLFVNLANKGPISWINISEFENYEDNGNIIFRLPENPISIKSTLESIYNKLHERHQIFEKYEERLAKIFDSKSIDIIKCLLKINSLNGENFLAVDSTSYKNSLERHDTDPMYRNWLRSILKGVMTTNGSLERIYILDTQESNKALSEFKLFRNEIAQYSDYINNYFTELLSIWEINGFKLHPSPNNNIKLYVVTTKQLNKLFPISEKTKNGVILKYPSISTKHKIFDDKSYDLERKNLSSQDFLICSKFTFNFLDKASNASSPEKKSKYILSTSFAEYGNEYKELKTIFDKLKDISYQIIYEQGIFILPSELSNLEDEIDKSILAKELQLKEEIFAQSEKDTKEKNKVELANKNQKDLENAKKKLKDSIYNGGSGQ